VTAAEQAARWVDLVWRDRAGYFFFAFGVGGHFDAHGKYAFERWQERYGRWPDDRDRFLTEALERADRDDVYVAPYLRSNASRKKGNALPSDVVYADLDAIDPSLNGFESALIGPGGMVVESGQRGHLHVYLHLPGDLDPAELERLNRHLAACLHADAGWAENKVLRLPGTWNHKGDGLDFGPWPVEILDGARAQRDWAPDELRELLGPEPPAIAAAATTPITPTMPENIPDRIRARLDEPVGEHPGLQTFSFVGDCIRAGLSDGQALALALEHRPTKTKYGHRATAEIERAIGKHRAGTTTGEVTSPDPSRRDKSDQSDQSPPAGDFGRFGRLGRRQTWMTPELEEAALHGPAGTWAEAVQPFTEACPVGVLVASLVAFGNAAGRSAYVPVTVTRHHANEFAILIGPTATGRKGESMRIGLRPLRLADEGWTARVQRGFGSGEAIVDAVRDEIVEVDAKGEERTVSGADDKRLLVHEEELASVLAVAGRDGSTLSPLIRSAWDGVRLENRTKGRKLVATDAHVSVLGAITADELVRKVAATEVANGFLNRFLLVAVKRTKLLSEPKPIPGGIENEYVEAFRKGLAFARREASGQMELDDEARGLWRQVYEAELSVDRYGLAGVACSRAEPHVLRLALLYALLDCSRTIGLAHLEAALAVWRYCERSALLVFGDRLGDPTADAILEAIRGADDGLTRTEIRDLFARHRSRAEIDAAVATLEGAGLIVGTPEQTGGRPAIRYRAATS
jgi:hypothetical protein